ARRRAPRPPPPASIRRSDPPEAWSSSAPSLAPPSRRSRPAILDEPNRIWTKCRQLARPAHRERGPIAFARSHIHAAAVRRDDLLHNKESQPQAVGVAIRGLRPALEGIEE